MKTSSKSAICAKKIETFVNRRLIVYFDFSTFVYLRSRNLQFCGKLSESIRIRMGQNICWEYWVTYRQRNEENIGARFIPAVSGPHCKESNEIPHSSKNDADEMRSQNVKQVGILLISELVWIFHASTIAQVQAFFTGGNGQGEIGKCVIKILLR